MLWMRIVDFAWVFIVFAFLMTASYLFLNLPNGFFKFVCAALSFTWACAAYIKIPTIEFALFVGCISTIGFYILIRLVDRITKDGVSLFKKRENEKPKYFKSFS